MRFRVEGVGLGIRVLCAGFWVWSFRVKGLRVSNVGIRVQGLGRGGIR